MNVHSIRVRAILLGFLLSGGVVGIIAIQVAAAYYTFFLLILTTVIWALIPFSAHALYTCVHTSALKQLVFTPPEEDEGSAQTTVEVPFWAITPLSAPTMSIPKALIRAFSYQTEPKDPADELGEPQITGEELDAMIEEAKRRQNVELTRRNRYVKWLSLMGLVHTSERYAHWCDTIDEQLQVGNNAS